MLPDAIRKEQDGWRERLFARVLPGADGIDALTKRQTEIYHVIEEHRAIALQELLRLTGTTAQTVRKLEDKNLIDHLYGDLKVKFKEVRGREKLHVMAELLRGEGEPEPQPQPQTPNHTQY